MPSIHKENGGINLEGMIKYPAAESTFTPDANIEDVLSSYQPEYRPESGGLLGALKGRFAEGVISATRPQRYKPDVLEAKGFDKVRVLSDKLSRFAQGFAGFPQDYTDEMVDDTMYHSSDMIKEIGGGIAEGRDELGDVTGMVRWLADSRDKERQIAEARTDMFALGLGRPQRYGHFVESKDKPSIGETDPESTYLDFKEGSDFKRLGHGGEFGEENLPFGFSGKDMRGGVLGRYKETPTDDYTSYYDLWDFGGKHGLGMLNTALEGTGLYTPHEVYGRMGS
jgi:hypothetical protein